MIHFEGKCSKFHIWREVRHVIQLNSMSACPIQRNNGLRPNPNIIRIYFINFL